MENEVIDQEKAPAFQSFGLEAGLQEAIDDLGYAACTPIQAQAIPLVLEKRDIAGLAQTGTGKTAAFLIPLMERILRAQKDLSTLSEEEKAITEARAFPEWQKNNFILILVPTRELAEQVFSNVEELGAKSGLRGVSIYGGTGYDKQKQMLAEGVEFVVATPGRLIDLYKDHCVDLRQVRGVVFDEADRMFDMGFKDDMKYILQRIPRERQFLVFSATLNFDVLNTAYQFEADPVEINMSRDVATAANVEDFVLHVGQHEKPAALLTLLKKYDPKQTIIFSNFKMNVERIARFLNENGYNAVGISSLLSQAQRNKVMGQFKQEGDAVNILVATDVAARGLDIENVDVVINYELPMDAESYVHRVGRTGRASAKGRAFSMSGHEDVDSLMRVEEYIKRKLEVIWLEEEELVKDHKPFPRDGSFNLKPVNRERPAKGGRSGGRRSDSRPPARQVKPTGPPPGRPRPVGEAGEAVAAGGDQDRATHRDKRRGRHKAAGAAAPNGNEDSRPSRPGARKGSRPMPKTGGKAAAAGGESGKGARKPSSRRRSSGSRRSASASAPRPPVPAGSEGIGKKVSSFFKKLFG